MAKGLRSSVKKSNKSKLRSRVFGPVEAARTERMSAKLLELASQPKPAKPQDTKMEIEGNGPESEDQSKVESKAADTEDVDMDEAIDAASKRSSKRKGTGRIQKKRRGKASSQIIFPTYKKGRHVGKPRTKR